jgi:hypothetical protein
MTAAFERLIKFQQKFRSPLAVREAYLLAFSSLREVSATFVAMALDARRKAFKRIQKRVPYWFSHSVLRRPEPQKRSGLKRVEKAPYDEQKTDPAHQPGQKARAVGAVGEPPPQ